ncbi:hypothetical protein F5Y15DRAFT_368218 [Xylariaceae sp. FL0016]|nr:hypothetical protein F5Y15DRAFT_368218 [Xylariaceae sp. FL0016]
MTANCTDAPTAVPSDAGVAGVGVLLSFIVTAAVSLVISASLIFQEWRGNAKPSVLRRKLLNAYSDQQILTGIGIQSVGIAKTDSMVPYHFFIVWMLSLLSMAVHNAALLALVHDFRRDWVLRWMRQFLMFVNLVLSCVYGVYILQAVREGLSNSTLPVSCVWDDSDSEGPANGAGVSYFLTVAVIAGNVIVFALSTWYLHNRAQKFYRVIQTVGLVIMTAFSIGAVVRVSLLADAFANPPIKLSDSGEQQWSFGQLLSVGMLLLPLVSVVEILRGEIKCALPVQDVGDDKARLLGEGQGDELQPAGSGQVRGSFQPNPLWGSQEYMFRK